MDRYTFSGNLGEDAKTQQAANGKTMVNFSVAIDKSYKDAQGNKVAKTKWISCTRFVDQGKTWGVFPYLKKGTKVLIDGEPDARGWVNQTTGEANAALNVLVRDLELMGSAPQAQPQPQAQQPRPQPVYAPETPDPADDNLPF